jgi:hypothetical protein
MGAWLGWVPRARCSLNLVDFQDDLKKRRNPSVPAKHHMRPGTFATRSVALL